MSQRVVTGALLAAVAVTLLYLGGAVLAIAVMVIICFAVYEEYHALSVAGHRPVSWPTWVGMALSIPLTLTGGVKMVLPVVLSICLLTLICVAFRRDPKLEDALMSILPLTTIVLPGISVIPLAHIAPRSLQLTLLALLLAVPCVGDIFAFMVGRKIGGTKLCPAVSPNKTVSGAIGGLCGSLLASLLVGLAAFLLAGEAREVLPAWWAYVLLGLIGGVAGQMGDLFASMVKRHCGIKDFSELFPGHGGMLDRLDSILFMAMVMFCYRLLTAL